jgi:hypothetical protein
MAFNKIQRARLLEKGQKLAKSRGFRKSNIVATVRSTRKNVRVYLTGAGEVGSEGRDGRHVYDIRLADAQEGWTLLYCSCPAQRFHVGYGQPCKHILALFDAFPRMTRAALEDDGDVTLYDVDAIQAEIRRIGSADVKGRVANG